MEEDLELHFDVVLLGVHPEEVNQLVFGLLDESGSRERVEGKQATIRVVIRDIILTV